MNRITINDKQYIFLETSEKANCSKCDLNEHLCDCMCYTMAALCGMKSGTKCLFKELKTEK